MSIFVRPFFSGKRPSPPFANPFFGVFSVFCLLALSGPMLYQTAEAVESSTSAELKSLSPNHCQPEWIAPPQTLPPPSAPNILETDQLTQSDENSYDLEGQVHISQPGSVILSPYARIDRAKQTADAWGGVTLYRPDVTITAQKMHLNQATNLADLSQTRYQFTRDRSHGRAAKIHLNKADQQANLESASYTTCRLIPGQPDAFNPLSQDDHYAWALEFSDLDINNQARRIYGYNTLLKFYDLPIFYTPYIDFPMDERASGLLFPTLGSHKSLTQSKQESYFSQPIYFNLAPHFDDTLTLAHLGQRGLFVENEFRYLKPNHSAELTLTGINDQLTGSEGLAYIDGNGNVAYGNKVTQRWRGKLTAKQQWAPGLNSDILWHEVSDDYFYADIPVEPSLSTVTQTERHINLNYQQGNLKSNLQLLNYLRLRNTNTYNYEKRPEFNLSYGNTFASDALKNFNYNLSAQITEFEIPYANHNKPEGQRRVFTPAISYANYQPFGQLEASLIGNLINDQLQDNANNQTGANEHQISVPQFAIKGGLNFERSFNFSGAHFVQTLEPQIQYLLVPYQDQSDIPLFDTGTRSLDFSNLFAYNRFSGSDRIGDTQQISAALTTRFLQENGSTIAEAGLGQIFYLDERKVQLSGNTPNTDKVSDYFVKLGAKMGPFYIASTSQFSNQNYELTNANNRLKIELSSRFKLLLSNSVSNYNKPGEQEDLAAGFNWKINQAWQLGSYFNYDFTENRRAEVQHALRYDSCCWASELSVQETQLANGLYNYGIQYVFELKGLSSVGTTFNDYLGNKLNF